MGVIAVCSEPWVVGVPSGALECPGELVQQSAPVAWSMTQAEVGDLLSATLLLFAVAFGVRTVVRFVLQMNAGRG